MIHTHGREMRWREGGREGGSWLDWSCCLCPIPHNCIGIHIEWVVSGNTKRKEEGGGG